MFLLLISISSYAQKDSVEFKVLWSKKIGDTSYYFLKNLTTKEKVYCKCCCDKLYKKGTIRMIAKKDEKYIE